MKQFVLTSWILLLQAVTAQLYYRFSILQRMLAEAIGHLPILMFWLSAGSSASNTYGYTRTMILFYFLAAATHEIIQDDSMTRTIAFDIRMGKLSSFLIRPYPFLSAAWMRVAGSTIVRILSVAPISIGIMFLISDIRTLLLASTGEQWLVYAAALSLAMLMSWCFRSCIGLLAFDMTQTWGPELVFISIYVVLSGQIFPVDILPHWAQQIIHWTPLYYMLGLPSLLFIGRLAPAVGWMQLAQGSIVLGISVLIMLMMWRRGIRKFEAVGI